MHDGSFPPGRHVSGAEGKVDQVRQGSRVVVIDAAIGAHDRGSRPVHYFTVAATLDKSLTSHCL